MTGLRYCQFTAGCSLLLITQHPCEMPNIQTDYVNIMDLSWTSPSSSHSWNPSRLCSCRHRFGHLHASKKFRGRDSGGVLGLMAKFDMDPIETKIFSHSVFLPWSSNLHPIPCGTDLSSAFLSVSLCYPCFFSHQARIL